MMADLFAFGRKQVGVRPLRDYQERDLKAIVEAFDGGKRSVLYVLPTGGGKTRLFSELIERFSGRRRRILSIAHRTELIDQASAALDHLGVRHGIIMAGRKESREAVQVGSIDTLGARSDRYQEYLGSVGLLIVDEAHHGVAAKYRRLLAAMPNAQVLGVTATPYRFDGQGLGDIFDMAIEGPGIRALTLAGHLVSALVYAPPAKLNLSKVSKRMGDYVASELAKVVDGDEVTAIAIASYRSICPDRPAIAFCASVDHAQHVAAAFQSLGINAQAIDGTTPAGPRERAIRGLANGNPQVLVTCQLVDEGTDVPAVGCAIFLAPTLSTGRYLQRIGRVLRPAPGKTDAIVLDIVGVVAEHGMPDEPRPWSLQGGVKGMERAVARTRTCRSCRRVAAVGPDCCPGCGKAYRRPQGPRMATQAADRERWLRSRDARCVFDLDVQTIRNARIDVLLAIALRQETDELRMKDLTKIAEARGYKRGWAWFKMQELRYHRRA